MDLKRDVVSSKETNSREIPDSSLCKVLSNFRKPRCPKGRQGEANMPECLIKTGRKSLITSGRLVGLQWTAPRDCVEAAERRTCLVSQQWRIEADADAGIVATRNRKYGVDPVEVVACKEQKREAM